jgi:hypothetical protein
MGLDATLSRIDGRPLGHRDYLVRIFERHFRGIEFGWTPSGPERLATARSRGVEYPPAVREYYETAPSQFEGLWEGPDGWLQLYWDGEVGATHLNLEFRGEWNQSDTIWSEILPQYGWQIEYCSSLIPPEQAIRRD